MVDQEKSLFTSVHLHTNVTCIEVIANHVFAGIGRCLNIFDADNHLVKKQNVFKSDVIFGIKPNSELNKLIVYGQKSITLVPVCCDSLELGKSEEHSLTDWILCARWIDDDTKFVTVSMHNEVILWTQDFRSQTSVICEVKCLVYSAYICFKRWKELLILSGTVFNEILLWRPSSVNLQNGLSTVVKTLKKHNIMYGAADGLPIRRRVRGASDYEDILAGNDFLSVFLESTLHRLKKETTTEDLFAFTEDTISTESYTRETRDATNYFNELPESTESSKTIDDGVIIAVHVSSSVDSQKNRLESFSRSESTTSVLDRNVLAAEEGRSILANAGKSELTVEEPTSITKEVQHLPYHYSTGNKGNSPGPFHHSLVYHDSPSEPGRARSVSYSSIIQNIQPSNEKPPDALERIQRNYETGTANDFNAFEKNKDENATPNAFTTTTIATSSEPTSLSATTTIKSWSKPYSDPRRKVYARQEQNYEVDEAVSVVTNGRTHGVQNTQKPKDDIKDKDQKVGYVVEGRDYRKYRVEERTSDGFIVGEYGVVSHNDGSLRGVRYTADGTINPRLIYDALMKFLAL
ncbi:uncharacterized protein LOC109543216 isoform X2 [Dendroctonus ponderosae]|uniref:uncharacterized protein LOC109543216 isoform X2 n=1 Tax=Dendroctonus ponderosae TaxID=77166 RepID=UPI00203596C2|nr:uncharacterized protein LOC109543216 isoform X2 [Dendroctonus ponderosae]